LPLEVDDEYIYVDHVDPQPAGLISKLTGFNLGIQIYMSLDPLATMELAYGIDEVFDWNRQKRILEECLRQVKHVLDNVPRELMLTPGSEPGQFKSPDRPYLPSMADYPSVRFNGREMGHWPQEDPEVRRRLQYEIQKANIYASQLGTRSYIVEKYWNLQEAHERETSRGDSHTSPGPTASGLDNMLPKSTTYGESEINVADEREIIVKDLLRVLGSISQINMEPNGGSFVSDRIIVKSHL